jgi:hypothetical protein
MLDRCPRYRVGNDPLSFLALDNSKKRAARAERTWSLLITATSAWRVARGAGGRGVAGARQLIFGENLPTFGANFLYRVIADPNSGYR